MKREKKLQLKLEEIKSKEKQISDLKENISRLDDIITIKNEKLKEVKTNLLTHYHKLLTEGLDTRKDGLIWIIKAIWGLGQKVISSHLPIFLDETSIAYLFKVQFCNYFNFF